MNNRFRKAEDHAPLPERQVWTSESKNYSVPRVDTTLSARLSAIRIAQINRIATTTTDIKEIA